jgi:hypothetical protein
MGYRAFERVNAVCRSCGWIGGTDNGLCILCQNLEPDPDAEPVVTGEVFAMWPNTCIGCGRDHDYLGEFCPRCLKELQL